MKKTLIIWPLIVSTFFANAQNTDTSTIDKEVFNISATIFAFGLLMIFILFGT